VFESDDVVFAWAIGKALMIVIVSFSTLVYLAWAVTWKRENAAHVGIPKDDVLKHKEFRERVPGLAHSKRNN
jgi:hypothetical protein